MKKPNITPTPWEMNFLDTTFGMSREEDANNNNAIVTAVNNTYGKNINPEAIQGLIDAVKMLLDNNTHLELDLDSVEAGEQALKNIYFE